MRSLHAFGTLAGRHINKTGTQAHWHVDHVDTQACMLKLWLSSLFSRVDMKNFEKSL